MKNQPVGVTMIVRERGKTVKSVLLT